MAALADDYAQPVKRVESRLRWGWSMEEAVDLPKGSQRKQKIKQLGTKSLKKYAEENGASYQKTWARIQEGWSLEEAVGLVERPRVGGKAKSVTVDGKVFRSNAQAARNYGISEGAWRKRVRLGWSPNQAAGIPRRNCTAATGSEKGTFVTDNIPDKRWLRLEIGLSMLLDSIVENVPEFLAVPSPPPWPRLHSGDGELDSEYVYLKSVQRRDKHPFGVVSVHLAKRVFDLAPRAFGAKAALPILSGLDGVAIGRAHQTMVIGTADTEIAELLQIELNAPTAEANCVVIDDTGIAIYVAQIVYRGDCIKFDIELTPKPSGS